MSLFVISCIDRPNSLELRMATRQSHLAYAHTAQGGVTVKLGGPYLDDHGNMAGSMIIVEAPDLAAAQAFSKSDPYVRAGLFETVEIRPFRVTTGPTL